MNLADKLVGTHLVRNPEDERRLATSGMRRWRGVFMRFTVLSNDIESAAYKAAMRLVAREIRDTSEDSRA